MMLSPKQKKELSELVAGTLGAIASTHSGAPAACRASDNGFARGGGIPRAKQRLLIVHFLD
jgi:hypothetical protein